MITKLLRSVVLCSFLLCATTAYNQQAKILFPQDSTDQVDEANATNIPDTLYFEWEGEIISIVTTDAKNLTDAVVQVVGQIKQNPPTSLMDWVALIISLITSGLGVTLFTNARKVYEQFKKLFGVQKSPITTVVIVSGLIGVIATFLWHRTFDASFFLMSWSSIFMVAIVFYDRVLKKDDKEGEPHQEQPSPAK